jgi:hypothetical protein
MPKDKIFISHTTPGDNYFTAWLASKLRLLGYAVWVELDELKLGDAFWPEIEDAIRSQSIKFLIVVSKPYLEKIKDPSSGIFKELSCADGIRNISNFKSPIRIDDVSFNDFPVQIMGLNAIDFYGNWQEGLDKLLDSLKKEKIPQDTSKFDNPLNFWLNAFKINDIRNSESEIVYTNWFPFELPNKIYIHKPIVKSKIDLVDIPYSYLEYSDRHISFFPKTDYPATIECSLSTELNINEIIEEPGIPIDDFLVFNEPRKKVVELLNKVIRDFLVERKLKSYQQANTEVFYYPSSSENRKRISLKALNKTNVAVAGKSKGNVWSYGISHYAILYPFPYFKINSHIIFERADLIVLDQEEQAKLRRSFGFDWYNKDWLDTLLGMMIKLSGEYNGLKIHVPINSSANLVVSATPFSVQTDFGYFEPAKEEQDAD